MQQQPVGSRRKSVSALADLRRSTRQCNSGSVFTTRNGSIHMAARPCVVDALRPGSSPRWLKPACFPLATPSVQICRLESRESVVWNHFTPAGGSLNCVIYYVRYCCTEGVANGNACGVLLNMRAQSRFGNICAGLIRLYTLTAAPACGVIRQC